MFSSSLYSKVIGYRYKMEDFFGKKVSMCAEINQPAFSKKQTEALVNDNLCDNVRPKTMFKFEKSSDKISNCIKVDVESGGKLFYQTTFPHDCDSIKPETKFQWVFENKSTYCQEVDKLTSGLEFLSYHNQEVCLKLKILKPKTRKYLKVVNNEYPSTSCIEEDIETSGKKFYLQNALNECESLIPPLVFEVRKAGFQKRCYAVDAETKGKKYINRCFDLDPNPQIQEIVKQIKAEEVEDKKIFNSLVRSAKSLFNYVIGNETPKTNTSK